jgi:hypothetical protein
MNGPVVIRRTDSQLSDVCDGSVMYGKLVAIQREIGRRIARGAIRAGDAVLDRD